MRVKDRSKAVAKYLEAHAEPEAALAAHLPERPERSYAAAIAVPLHAESVEFLQGYQAVPGGVRGRVLLILVVNGRASDELGVQASNRRLLDDLRALPSARRKVELGEAFWLETDAMDLLCIDRASAGRQLPDSEGVGLARKIGCDVALAMAARRRLDAGWVYVSDADVSLPPDYLQRKLPAHASALAFRFRHVPCGDPELDCATSLYEASLRYYVLGLGFARSPYAFHTIGSTLALELGSYAAVRGFPRRRAGEDFYLLNKLAKLGSVVVPGGMPIQIRSRISDRVPFGTGAATRRILDEWRGGLEFRVYAPETFAALSAWIAALDAGVGSPAPLRARSLRDEAVARVDREQGPKVGSALAAALERLELPALAERTDRGVPHAQRPRRIREWFDAFRTLKLIHELRNRGLADVRWDEAFGRARFLDRSASWQRALDSARAGSAGFELLLTELERAEPQAGGLASVNDSLRPA